MTLPLIAVWLLAPMGSTKIYLLINAQRVLQVALRALVEAARIVFPAQAPTISHPLPANA